MPGVPFSREAVANAFVMLGLLPEQRAEEILAGHRLALEAKGFRLGVLTGELSVRPGALGFQDAQRRAGMASHRFRLLLPRARCLCRSAAWT